MKSNSSAPTSGSRHAGAELPDLRFEGGHPVGREHPGHQAPVDGVHRRVLEDEHPRGHLDVGPDELDDAAPPGDEGLVVEVAALDVGEPADRVEVVGLVVVERRLLPQPAEDRVRVGVDVHVVGVVVHIAGARGGHAAPPLAFMSYCDTKLRVGQAQRPRRRPGTARGWGTMKTHAAVLWGREQDWQIEEIDLDPPEAPRGAGPVGGGRTVPLRRAPPATRDGLGGGHRPTHQGRALPHGGRSRRGRGGPRGRPGRHQPPARRPRGRQLLPHLRSVQDVHHRPLQPVRPGRGHLPPGPDLRRDGPLPPRRPSPST